MSRTVLSRRDVEMIRRVRAGPSSETAAERNELVASGLAAEAETGDAWPQADAYRTRLLKYIPAEVVALYVSLEAMIRSGEPSMYSLLWMAFGVGVLAVPLYLRRIQKVRKVKQLVISTLAFCVWVFAIGGPFASLGWYSPIYGGSTLFIYTFFVPIMEG